MQNLQIPTARVFLPLFEPARYKGAKGGRGSAKSHFFAELLVEEHVTNENLKSVCIREVQKSLKFSAKALIESKIKKFNVSHLFEITQNEIRRKDADGIIIFQGLQDHTADSIKSLEGFNRAWVEEAQSISKRSMELLLPTIREDNSQIWFSWNPDQADDPVEQLFNAEQEDCILVHSNYLDNPFLPDTLKKEAERHMRVNPQTFGHVWLGEFNTLSDSKIFNGKWRTADFEITNEFDGPYIGLDFGFSADPTALAVCWISDNKLYISHDTGKQGLELDDTAQYLIESYPDIVKTVIRADNARPESISYLKRSGLPHIKACEKGKGSVEDGIEFIKSFDEIVIHNSCQNMQNEARNYSYVIDRHSGDILPRIEDKHNHWWDAVRYALEPIMKARKAGKAPNFFR